ncbi:MAG TPA: 2-oxoacid:acceptor oxidoreductase family protein [Armatimonadota bacterium]|nr:2-oxoacid:acceptor oxidoreductase family protein [Armatimonadota bacterium]
MITPCETKIHHELIIAGFGGQGVLKLGLTLVEAAMHEGREVIWTPAYGPEMRGGPSFCTVIISSDPIGAPVVDQVDTAIIMDRPSLSKYQYRVRKSGIIIINSSLVDASELRKDIACYAIPANQLAEEIGEPRTANMVVLGALLHLTKLATPETVIAALAEALPERHRNLIPLNERALLVGAERVEKLS